LYTYIDVKLFCGNIAHFLSAGFSFKFIQNIKWSKNEYSNHFRK